MAFTVLVIHGTYDGITEYPLAYWFQNCFMYGFCRVAVPIFFMISGYLFYSNIRNWKDCLPKIKKRMRTLLVPYLLWNLLFVLVFLALALLPVSKFVNNTQIVDNVRHFIHHGDLLGIVSYLYWPQPVNIILWYVRDLFIFVLFTPLLYFILKNKKVAWATMLLLAAGTIMFYNNTVNGLVFFVIGAYLSIHEDLSWLSYLSKKLFLPAIIIYVSLSLIAPYNPFQNYTFLLLHMGGVISIWHLYDCFHERINIPKNVLGYGFFIYCFHMPFYNIKKKGIIMITGGGTL